MFATPLQHPVYVPFHDWCQQHLSPYQAKHCVRCRADSSDSMNATCTHLEAAPAESHWDRCSCTNVNCCQRPRAERTWVARISCAPFSRLLMRQIPCRPLSSWASLSLANRFRTLSHVLRPDEASAIGPHRLGHGLVIFLFTASSASGGTSYLYLLYIAASSMCC